MTNKTYEEVQILRAFAILAVVIKHVITFHGIYLIANETNYIVLINSVIDLFSGFAVPLFILISGLVLGLKYNGNYDLFSFYKKRMLSIVPPYLTFSFIYIFYSHFSAPLEQSLSFSDIFFRLLTGKAYFHLWFFVILIQFYIIFPLVSNLMSRIGLGRAGLKIIIYLLILQIAWDTLAYNLLLDPVFNKMILSFFLKKIFLSYLIYFVLGIYFSNNFVFLKNTLNNITNTTSILIVLILLTLKSYVVLMNIKDHHVLVNILSIIFSPLLYICTFIMLFKLAVHLIKTKNVSKSLFIFLGDYSFGIYLVHLIILSEIVTASVKIWNLYYYYHWEYYLFSFIITMCVSVVLLKSATLLPYSKFLIGIRTQKIDRNIQ